MPCPPAPEPEPPAPDKTEEVPPPIASVTPTLVLGSPCNLKTLFAPLVAPAPLDPPAPTIISYIPGCMENGETTIPPAPPPPPFPAPPPAIDMTSIVTGLVPVTSNTPDVRKV